MWIAVGQHADPSLGPLISDGAQELQRGEVWVTFALSVSLHVDTICSSYRKHEGALHLWPTQESVATQRAQHCVLLENEHAIEPGWSGEGTDTLGGWDQRRLRLATGNDGQLTVVSDSWRTSPPTSSMLSEFETQRPLLEAHC